MAEIEVAIIGAGPYGISVAAWLNAKGIPNRIFGEPMKSWKVMPKGMYLKSLGFATSLSVPQAGMDFPAWLKQRGMESFEPITYASFAEYGEWIQQKFVPGVEKVDVSKLERNGAGFKLTLENGEILNARQVVVAVGLGPFQRMPKELEGLPRSLVSHTFGWDDYAPFAGKEVAVVGVGQSALEAAAKLHEQGAKPTILARGPGIFFHTRMAAKRSIIEKLRNPLSVLGPGRKNWVFEKLPWALYYLPDDRRVKLAMKYLGPVGSWWLQPRVEGKVPVVPNQEILSAKDVEGKIELKLRDKVSGKETERKFDHVISGTGFVHELDKLTFIEPGLRASLTRVKTAPKLTTDFESSVPRLYFVGPFSAYSFGPLFRFVCGVYYAAPHVVKRLAAVAKSQQASAPVQTAASAG
jgi:cation diffusion facilitator CzcD-associated flavoprotein CzcO